MKTPQLGSAIIPIPITAGSGGDVTGSLPGDLSVVKIRGIPICTDTPAVNDVLTFDGTRWCPAGIVPVGNFLTNTYGEQAGLVTVAASGASYTIDVSAGNTFDITLTAACVLSISNPAPAGVDSHIVVILRQGGTGSYTVTWPGSVKWQSATGTNTGSAPTLWTAVGAQDVIELSTEDGGTTWGGYLTPHPPTAFTLTVDDEGTPLATGATSLDFVGAGVTASGATAAKTITIPGGATASDAGIWRPLLDSATGAIIVNGTTGEATMGFGPA